MPEWLSKEQIMNTPSRRDGIDADREGRYRRECIHFIKQLAIRLSLAPKVYLTAMHIFHRLFMSHSFKDLSRLNFAAACLFIGGKIEEQPKRLQEFLPATHELKQRARKQPLTSLNTNEYGRLKFLLQGCERAILQTIDFKLRYAHPLDPIIRFAKSVKVAETGERCPDKLVQQAINAMNDSYLIPLCLQYPAEEVGAALLEFGARKCRVRLQWAGEDTDTERSKTDTAAQGKRPWYEGALSHKADYGFIDAVIGDLEELRRLRTKAKTTATNSTPSDVGTPQEASSSNTTTPVAEEVRGSVSPAKRAHLTPTAPQPSQQQQQQQQSQQHQQQWGAPLSDSPSA